MEATRELYNVPLKELQLNEHHHQSKDDDPSKPSRSIIYSNPKKFDQLSNQFQNWRIAYDVFETGVLKSPEDHCLGQRLKTFELTNSSRSMTLSTVLGEFQWITYSEVKKLALQLGTSLCRLNLCPQRIFPDEEYSKAQNLRPLGIFAKNCVEWLIIEQACNAFGFTLVPLYDTLGEEALTYITEQTQVSCIIVSTECLEVLKNVITKMKSVQSIILLDVGPWITTKIPAKSDPQRIIFNESFSKFLSGFHLYEDLHLLYHNSEDSVEMPSKYTASAPQSNPSVSTMTSFPNVTRERSTTNSSTVGGMEPRFAKSTSSSRRIGLYCFSDLIDFGKTDTMEPVSVDPESVQTLCYTSGTTGIPKGAIITHGAFVENLKGLLQGVFKGTFLEMSVNDVHLSYLPLAHIYERIIIQLCYSAGASIGIYSGDILKLFEDIRKLQPTISVGVPRVFSKLLDKVQLELSQKNSIIQFIYRQGVMSKLKCLREDGSFVHGIWDRLIFNKIKNQVYGGRLRFIISSAAAIDLHTEELMQILFSVPLLPAYGLTESIGAAFTKYPGDPSTGHVGGILPWAEFCLESVTEMEANAKGDPPQGEILIRGSGMSSGYFRNRELTHEVFENRWYHTGDIGIILPNRALKIIDRKKNIFKLSQGEYVSPEKIEVTYCKASLISQIFVYGESNKDFLVGIIVPDSDTSLIWARKNDINIDGIDMLTKNEYFILALKEEMKVVEREDALKGFEKVKLFKLESAPFSIANDLLTPTMKLKRLVAKKRFFNHIEEMYNSCTL